jgi:hypothetical protein
MLLRHVLWLCAGCWGMRGAESAPFSFFHGAEYDTKKTRQEAQTKGS